MSSLSSKIVKEAVRAGLPQPICEKTVSFTLGFKAALEEKQFSDPDQPKYVSFFFFISSHIFFINISSRYSLTQFNRYNTGDTQTISRTEPTTDSTKRTFVPIFEKRNRTYVVIARSFHAHSIKQSTHTQIRSNMDERSERACDGIESWNRSSSDQRARQRRCERLRDLQKTFQGSGESESRTDHHRRGCHVRDKV